MRRRRTDKVEDTIMGCWLAAGLGAILWAVFLASLAVYGG
jgi:hypothetical protein